MHNLKFRDLGQSRQQRFSSRRRHSICSNFKMLESHLIQTICLNPAYSNQSVWIQFVWIQSVWIQFFNPICLNPICLHPICSNQFVCIQFVWIQFVWIQFVWIQFVCIQSVWIQFVRINLFESNLFASNLIDYVQKPTIIFKETFFLGRILNLFAVIAIEQANTTPDPMNRTSGLLASPFLMVNLV